MLNKADIIGRVGKDPEIKHAQNGMTIAKFSIATSEKIKGEEKTEWHNLTAFGKLAEIIQKYVKKGDLLYVSGKIKTDSWENQQGEKRYSTGIIVNEMKMLGGQQSQASVKQESSTGQANQDPDFGELDDIPF